MLQMFFIAPRRQTNCNAGCLQLQSFLCAFREQTQSKTPIGPRYSSLRASVPICRRAGSALSESSPKKSTNCSRPCWSPAESRKGAI